MESNLIHSKLKMKGKNVEWLANEMTAYGQTNIRFNDLQKFKRRSCFQSIGY